MSASINTKFLVKCTPTYANDIVPSVAMVHHEHGGTWVVTTAA